MELLLIPLLFALISLVVPTNLVRYTALAGGLISSIVAVITMCSFDTSITESIFDPNVVTSFGLTYKMGYDGMSLFMVVLTNIMVFIILLSNHNREIASNKSFNALVFFMQFALLGVFTSLDGLMFYIFWEITLIPVFMIALWFGSEERKPILIKFFIYTFVGSLAMLLALMGIKSEAVSFAWTDLHAAELSIQTAYWIFAGFFLAFAIKIPLFPFHTWQPSTYTVSPMAGTMLLSALMLKMALYGMVRWMVPLAPEALEMMQPIVIGMGVIGVVYAGVIAIMQSDIKRMFAFASISHVGLIAAGLILFTHDMLAATYIQILNHSLVAIGLFLAVDILEKRIGSRNFKDLGGVASLAPRFAFMFAVIALASVSVPFSSGFIGEFMLLRGLFDYNWIIGVVAGTTLILGAIYTLRAYQLSMFGPAKQEAFEDLTWNEWLAFFIIASMILLFGLCPQMIIDFLEPSINTIIDSIQISNI